MSASGPVALTRTRTTRARVADAVKDWRNRVIASPRFQRWSARFPLTRRVARRKAAEVFDIAAGFVYSQVLWACVELDLFETLRAGAMPAADLARICRLPGGAMLRLLRAADSLGLLERRGDEHYALGERGAAVLGNPGITAMIAHNQLLYRDLAQPLPLLRGEVEAGLATFWPYREADSREARRYSELMSASQSMVTEDILDAFPMGEVRHLWDIAGGDGTFAAAALQRWPHLRATVLDLEPVAGLAQQRFLEAGLAARGRGVAGNMFDAPLAGSAESDFGPPDLVSLVRVVHDHDDRPVAALLAKLREAMAPGGTVLLAEPMAESPGAEPMGHAYFGLYLFAMGSGRPRTARELKDMLGQAGFSNCRELRSYRPLMVRVLAADA